MGDGPDAAPEAQNQHPRLLHAVHHRRHWRRSGGEAEHDDVGLHLGHIDDDAGQSGDACGATASTMTCGAGANAELTMSQRQVDKVILGAWGCWLAGVAS